MLLPPSLLAMSDPRRQFTDATCCRVHAIQHDRLNLPLCVHRVGLLLYHAGGLRARCAMQMRQPGGRVQGAGWRGARCLQTHHRTHVHAGVLAAVAAEEHLPLTAALVAHAAPPADAGHRGPGQRRSLPHIRVSHGCGRNHRRRRRAASRDDCAGSSCPSSSLPLPLSPSICRLRPLVPLGRLRIHPADTPSCCFDRPPRLSRIATLAFHALSPATGRA